MTNHDWLVARNLTVSLHQARVTKAGRQGDGGEKATGGAP